MDIFIQRSGAAVQEIPEPVFTQINNKNIHLKTSFESLRGLQIRPSWWTACSPLSPACTAHFLSYACQVGVIVESRPVITSVHTGSALKLLQKFETAASCTSHPPHTQTFLPARIAFPGCVSLALPSAAAAAKQRGLGNGFTKLGCPDMTAIPRQNFFSFFSVNTVVLGCCKPSQPSSPPAVRVLCAAAGVAVQAFKGQAGGADHWTFGGAALEVTVCVYF